MRDEFIVAIQNGISEIFLVRIPLPFELKHVNCYLIKEHDGWSIVDTGFNWPQAVETWNKAFTALGVEVDKIKSIYITHWHPDHIGLARWFAGISRGRLYITKTDIQMASSFWQKPPYSYEKLQMFFRAHGMPSELTDKITAQINGVAAAVLPLPEFHYLEPDHVIQVGNLKLKVISTPGHSDGHACLYEDNGRVLFTGDHVLPDITPNISLWPGASQNPLKNYLRSLAAIQSLNAAITLPAHGRPVFDLAGRIKEILHHHEERLKAILAILDRPRTAYEVSLKLFGSDISVHQQRFAFSESLAHLVYLVEEQLANCRVINGTFIFVKN